MEWRRQATDERHPLHGHVPAPSRLKSQRSFLTCTAPLETTPSEARLNMWKEKLSNHPHSSNIPSGGSTLNCAPGKTPIQFRSPSDPDCRRGGRRAVRRSGLLSAPRAPSPFPFSQGFFARHRPLQLQGAPVCQFPKMIVNSARASPPISARVAPQQMPPRAADRFARA